MVQRFKADTLETIGLVNAHFAVLRLRKTNNCFLHLKRLCAFAAVWHRGKEPDVMELFGRRR